MKTQIQVKKLSPDAIIPTRGTKEAAGFDLYSIEDKQIPPGGRQVVGTGIAIAMLYSKHAEVLPVGKVCSRSGLAAKLGVFVLNAPGIIDADYRGEIKVILQNSSPDTVSIKKGDRIAQLLISTVLASDFTEVTNLDDTERGTGGLGSTGK